MFYKTASFNFSFFDHPIKELAPINFNINSLIDNYKLLNELFSLFIVKSNHSKKIRSSKNIPIMIIRHQIEMSIFKNPKKTQI